MTGISTAITGPVRLRVQLIYPKIALFQVGLFVAMIYRGLDYLTPPDEDADSFSVVEEALPLPIWGLILLAFSILGLLGLRWTRFPLAAVAHAAGVGLYSAFSAGLILSIASRADVVPPSAFAWTVAATLAVCSVIVFVLVYRYARHNHFYAWVFLAAAVTAAVVTLANSAGVYGWRTATGWLFVQCIAHSVMADASWDAWLDSRQEPNDAEPS